MNQKRGVYRQVTYGFTSFSFLTKRFPKKVDEGEQLPAFSIKEHHQNITMGNHLPKCITITASLIIGITVGIQTSHVEDRPELGWLVGIVSTVVVGSLMFTLISESHCGWMRCVGRRN